MYTIRCILQRIENLDTSYFDTAITLVLFLGSFIPFVINGILAFYKFLRSKNIILYMFYLTLLNITKVNLLNTYKNEHITRGPSGLYSN